MLMKKMTGFTLIELMIVTAIVAVLAAIAVPMYQDSVKKSRRAEAVSALTTGAQRLEAFYTANGTYLKADGSLASVFTTAVPSGGSAYYNIAQVQGTAATATTFKLVATPAGAMTGDECGNLALDQTGARTRSGSVDESLCWRR
jgi:type IV pilus assembly protein PilE